jgi:hypothetical protein
MKEIKIELQRAGYLPGEIVEGAVNLTIDKPVKARKVKLDVLGVEETRITVSHGKSSTTYRSKNNILKEMIVLHGPQFEKNLEMEPGNYVFKFEFKIPEYALPSYNGTHAFINYQLHARVDVPFWLDIVDKKPFYIFRDRGHLNQLTNPAHFQSKNYIQPYSKKPSFYIQLPKTGFAVGEQIECALTMKNMAATRIRKIDLRLIGQEYAWAQGYTRTISQKKHEIEIPFGDIIEGVTRIYYIQIPSDTQSSYEGRYSNFRWVLEVNLDIPLGFDVKAMHQVEIIR